MTVNPFAYCWNMPRDSRVLGLCVVGSVCTSATRVLYFVFDFSVIGESCSISTNAVEPVSTAYAVSCTASALAVLLMCGGTIGLLIRMLAHWWNTNRPVNSLWLPTLVLLAPEAPLFYFSERFLPDTKEGIPDVEPRTAPTRKPRPLGIDSADD